jgi:hypothetical protein
MKHLRFGETDITELVVGVAGVRSSQHVVLWAVGDVGRHFAVLGKSLVSFVSFWALSREVFSLQWSVEQM